MMAIDGISTTGAPVQERDAARGDGVAIEGYLKEVRELVRAVIETIVTRWLGDTAGERCAELRARLLDYPLRDAKGLRPALCIATSLALGGTLEATLPSAAALELYHNAFLIHDDIEDGSEQRRGKPTLHRLHGIPAAINAGDALLSLTLEPLLDNTRRVGLGPALEIVQIVSEMCRQSVAGQLTELEWVADPTIAVSDDEYVRMVYQKTTWYSFIAPMLIGAVIAGAPDECREALRRAAYHLGIAFQIRDDVLNLVGDGARYGKELDGDLWEGKRTLILLHALRESSAPERERMVRILGKARPTLQLAPGLELKTAADVAFLRARIEASKSIDYASAVADEHARECREAFALVQAWLSPSTHRQFLEGLVGYVTERTR